METTYVREQNSKITESVERNNDRQQGYAFVCHVHLGTSGVKIETLSGDSFIVFHDSYLFVLFTCRSSRIFYFCISTRCLRLFEPPHDKPNKLACAPSDNSNQPGHPPSLIRVFALRMKKAWVLSYPLTTQRRL